MELIEKLYQGVKNGEINEPFTTEEFKEWIKNYHIKKDDGSYYSKSSIESLLSNSSKHNNPTSNLNKKVLFAKTNNHGKREYWF